MEKSIEFESEIGVMELRHLHELSNLNKALTKKEFMQIVSVYQIAIERLTKVAEEQGIKI